MAQLVEKFNDDMHVYEDEYGIRTLHSQTRDVAMFHVKRAERLGATTILYVWLDSYASITDPYNLIPVPLGDEQAPAPPVKSNFVHLHTHSEFSALDGLSTVKELVDKAVSFGQSALAITDHGVCASHPFLQQECDRAGIKPIYGIEAYFVDDRLRRPKGLPEGKKMADLTPAEREAYERDNAEVKDYWHLLLLATSDVGLKNLWAMSTEANRDGFYHKPRMDWDTLARHSEGIIVTSACIGGPLSKPLLAGDLETALFRLARMKEIFGAENVFLELHTNELDDQIRLNNLLVGLSQSTKTPLIAVCDSHYSCVEHADTHKVWLAASTGSTLSDESNLFEGDGGSYHFRSEQEVREALSYLPAAVVEQAILNTGLIADRVSARLPRETSLPIFSPSGRVEDDVDRLYEVCVANWADRLTGSPISEETYVERFRKEADLIIEKQFCGYFLLVSDYCLWAKRHGILVGPGRGSGGGSLIAYLMGITEINPVEADLLFERFITKGRKELPDFDIDFPSSRIAEVQEYIEKRWGPEHVVRVGTQNRLKNKGVIDKTFMAHKGIVEADFMDRKKMSTIITEAESGTAGLGLSWDELWEVEADKLGPYRAKYPEIFRHADTMVGRLFTYGKHAAGIVISTGEPLTDRLPLRHTDKGDLVSEFDMDALTLLGYVKFDFLAIKMLDVIQGCIDSIRSRHEIDISPYRFRSEYDDQRVWKYIGEGNTLGCFQIETNAGKRVTKEVKPQSLNDLSDVVTLDRPGPMRSGLDKVYYARRNGREDVTLIDPRLEPFLKRSYGVMLYQEDVMATCMVIAGYDGEEADHVRKIMGKKDVGALREEQAKFIPAAVARGMDRKVADTLWEQMAEFSRYAFNRAHAYAYGTLAYWSAWFKFHFPLEFYAASMSVVDQDKIGALITDAKKGGHAVVAPDINDSKIGFTIAGIRILYGFEAIKGIGEKAAEAVVAMQPYADFADFMARRTVDAGTVKHLIKIGAFDRFDTNRRKLERIFETSGTPKTDRCSSFDPSMKATAPNELPCAYDWSKEPVTIGKSGKPLKQKPIPKQCTVRCRNFTPVAPDLDVTPYTEREIRDLEMEYLGIHLTSTPFDYILSKYNDVIATASMVDQEDRFERADVLGLVKTVTEKSSERGGTYALINLFAVDGDVHCICFSDNWKKIKPFMRSGQMVIGSVSKNDRGYRLINALPADEWELVA